MKKKIFKLMCMLLVVFSLTGCTKYINNDKNKVIKNEANGQNVVKNILCKPTDKKLLSIYDDYNKKAKKQDKININDLPTCENLKVSQGKYEGIWTTVFVKPLAWFIIKLGNLVKNYGLGLILATLIIRGVVYPFTKKAAMQSEMLKKAKPELDKLEKKYKDKTDQESMMKKSQEMLMIYKKYNISPFGSCLISFIQLPLFFGFLEAINRIPAIFEGDLGAYQLGTTPLIGIKSGNYFYIVLILLIILTTYLSFKFSMSSMGNADQQKQMKMMTGFMLVFISIASFSLPTAIALYWVVTNGFSVVQNLIMKRGKM